MLEEHTLLYFEFMDHSQQKMPLIFEHPIRVLSTYNVREVIPLLEEAQAMTRKGYYAAGYLSYESAPAFDSDFKVQEDIQFPLLWFAIFKGPIEQELKYNRSFTINEWLPSKSKSEYFKDIDKIKHYIEENHFEQINHTIRMSSDFGGDGLSLYTQLSQAQSANYSAYIHTKDFSILSASPELFFHTYNNHITTRPMKGTIHRGKSYKEDIQLANWLYHSRKNRNENELALKHMKDELNNITKETSLKTTKKYTIETYPTVHQMTSTITGELKDKTSIIDIFKTLFPSVSITGNPKKNTMEAIYELENTPREIYCGAMGYITPDQEAIFNVPIRTAIIDHTQNTIQYGVGGGITNNSNANDEYKEVYTKAKLLSYKRPSFQLLESLLLDDGEYFLLDYHLQRLEQSAYYFKYDIDTDYIEQQLKNYAQKKSIGKQKVRLCLDKSGELTIEGTNIELPTESKRATLAKEHINSGNIFLYHKTTMRDQYTYHKNTYPHMFDVLLWNERAELTEFTSGNIVVQKDGEFLTPKQSSGLLAGVYREKLIHTGKIKEVTLTKDDLEKCQHIYLINSVRKWITINLV